MYVGGADSKAGLSQLSRNEMEWNEQNPIIDKCHVLENIPGESYGYISNRKRGVVGLHDKKPMEEKEASAVPRITHLLSRPCARPQSCTPTRKH